ncbi:MAG: cell division protein ZapA [Deltaproteobacteria bacterium]|nr:cell division protein ZapA [Deltaproteobacteria bacterium]
MKKSYEVNILGQKFVLKTDNDESHVKKVADYVNKVMHSIKEKTSTISTQNIAILGALNIAEETFKEKDEFKAMITDWRDRLKDSLQE